MLPTDPLLPDATVRHALRSWCAARGAAENAQQCLYRLLDPLGYGLLAPVIDVLFQACATCARRPLSADATDPSSDEQWIVRLLASPEFAPAPCGTHDEGDGGTVLGCAVCSARIMIGRVLAERPILH